MKTSEKIIEYIKKRRQVSGSELTAYLGISDRGVRKQLSSLLTKGLLQKIGKPPKVYYSIKQKDKKENNIIIDEKIKLGIEPVFITCFILSIFLNNGPLCFSCIIKVTPFLKKKSSLQLIIPAINAIVAIPILSGVINPIYLKIFNQAAINKK